MANDDILEFPDRLCIQVLDCQLADYTEWVSSFRQALNI